MVDGVWACDVSMVILSTTHSLPELLTNKASRTARAHNEIQQRRAILDEVMAQVENSAEPKRRPVECGSLTYIRQVSGVSAVFDHLTGCVFSAVKWKENLGQRYQRHSGSLPSL